MVHSEITNSYDIEAVLNYIAEKLLMDKTFTGERKVTVFDDFDETRPFDGDKNPLQARFLHFLRFAINNVRRGQVQRLSNVERRPQGTVSIVPGRPRRGDPSQGVSSDEIADRSGDDPGLAELVD